MGGGGGVWGLVTGFVGGTVGFFIGGPAGAVAGAAIGMMTYSTIEGAATGRLFSSPTAFLFEPTRAICELLGITDKDITTGYMCVSKVFHENQYKDTLVKNHIARNKDGTGVVKYFYDFSKVGQAQFDKYYRLGKSEFIDSLPTSSVASSTVKLSTIVAAIKASLNVNAVIDHTSIGYPDDTEWVQWKLQQQGLYNYATDIVTISNKKYNISNTSYNINNNKIVANLKGIDGNQNNTTRTFDPPALHTYYIVVYHTTTNPEVKLWIHTTDLSSLGANFTNENPNKMLKSTLDCLPIVCMRNNKIDVSKAENNKDATASFKKAGRYEKSKKLLSSLGIPIDDIIKEYRKNKDIDDVYDVYFLAGVSPAQTLKDAKNDPEGAKFSKQVLAKYLYTTISAVYEALPCVQEGQPYFFTFEELPLKGQIVWAGVPVKHVKGKKCEHKCYALEVGSSAKKYYRVILQRFETYLGSELYTHSNYDSEGYAFGQTTYTIYKYKVKYMYVDISSSPVTPQKIIDSLENLTPFYPTRSQQRQSNANSISGSNSPTFPSEVHLQEQINHSLPYYKILKSEEVWNSDDEGNSYSSTRYTYENLLDLPRNTGLDVDLYTSQYKENSSISVFYQSEPDEYEEIIARNCTSLYYTETVDQDLLGSAHADSENFIFPISYQGLKKLSVYDKTKFLSESFYFIFFAKKTQHLEFYQTPEFASLLKIVGICIVVVIQVFTWWSGPASSMTAMTVLETLIDTVAIYVGVTLALKVISIAIPDSTLKAMLSAAVMVAAIAIGGGFSDFNISTAVQLAEVPSKAIDIYTKDQMKYAQQDMLDLNARYQEALKTNESIIGQSTQGLDIEDVLSTQSMTREWGGRLLSVDEFYTISITCPDLYDVCQGQIDRQKSTDLDDQYPLFRM